MPNNFWWWVGTLGCWGLGIALMVLWIGDGTITLKSFALCGVKLLALVAKAMG
jgi:hypothetical protein